MHARGRQRLTYLSILTALCIMRCGSSGTPDLPNNHPPGPDYSVLEHHNGPSRNGLYTHSSFTHATASTIHLALSTPISGVVNAQPLFVDGQGAGPDMVLVATMQNQVFAINASTGAVIWRRVLDPPLPLDAVSQCGFFDPFGISGTPVIDGPSRRIYLDLVTPDDERGAKHLVYALSLDNGSTISGWPVDVGMSVSGFSDLWQQQRGALTLLRGWVYIPYGGYGDCEDYYGRVVGVSTSNPASVVAWRTDGNGASIWAPSGIASDGTWLYVATSNSDPNAPQWSGSETVFRLQPGLSFSGSPADYYTPQNWRTMDQEDLDLGSSGVTLFDLPGPSPTPMLATLGKDARIHLINRANLGGVNGAWLVEYVSLVSIITAPSVHTNARGTRLVYTGFRYVYDCSDPNGNVASIQINTTPGLSLSAGWCANAGSRTTSTIVTTTDGTSEPIVWVVGQKPNTKLFGFDGDTGALIASADGAAEVMHYTAPIAAKGKIYVAGTDRLYVFAVNSP